MPARAPAGRTSPLLRPRSAEAPLPPGHYHRNASSAATTAAATAGWRALLRVGSTWLGGVRASGQAGSAAILLYARWVLAQRLPAVLRHYGRVVVTRSDYVHCEAHPPVDFRKVWIPRGEEDWGGLTDRHAVYPSRLVLSALGVLSRLFAAPEARAAELLRKGSNWNLETVLHHHFTQIGLMPRVDGFKLAALNVEPIGYAFSRWNSQNNQLPALGVAIKYPRSYAEWHPACKSMVWAACAASTPGAASS